MFKMVNRLGTGLGKATLRHEVLSNNLSNFNTPGFKRSDVQMNPGFSALLTQAVNTPLRRTDQRHLPGGAGAAAQPFTVVNDQSHSMRNDGNNVDPDREKVLLLENQLYYDSLIEAVTRKLGQIRSVIGEGRR